MELTRRNFLRQAGLALTAFGFSECGLSLLASRYQQALAVPTRRKLALLVGINQYSEQVCDYIAPRGSALNGCLTDVALQQELLIHRFGFQAIDILTLTDQQATRQAIELAFRTHLIEQVRPGDVVVVHFSGLGSQVKLIDSSRTYRSFVPIDGVLPTAENPAINDVLEETLGLLLRSLPTNQVTTVLDLSYGEPDRTPQGLRVRSRPSTPTGQLNEAERVLQDMLTAQLNPSQKQLNNQEQTELWPGVVLRAADINHAAIEFQWSGFSAGLFTYALTQQLWQTTPQTTLRFSFSQTTETVKHIAGREQHPQLSGQKSSGQMLPYNLTASTRNADGVVTAVEEDGKTFQVWLGGLPLAVLDYYGGNSLLALSSMAPSDNFASSGVLSPDSDSDLSHVSLLQGRSRDGLTLRARLLDASAAPPQVGQFVHETLRILPRNISLVVALDSSLERIERVDATSAFATISNVSTVIAGEQPADYLFGKTLPRTQTWAAPLASNAVPEEALVATASASPPLKESYGLFNLSRAVIPNTLTGGEEAVKTAVNRLTPKLRVLLAAKLLRLTSNSNSSQLGVQATLELVAPQKRVVMQQQTTRARLSPPASQLTQLFVSNGGIPTLPVGSRVRYRLYNYSDRPIYFTAMGLHNSGNAIALYGTLPTDSPISVPGSSDAIAPGATLTIPQDTAPDLVIDGPIGFSETHFIFSCEPLNETAVALNASAPPGSTYRVGALPHPLDAVQAVLRDLHQASIANGNADAVDTYTLDVRTWATLSFFYQVGEG